MLSNVAYIPDNLFRMFTFFTVSNKMEPDIPRKVPFSESYDGICYVCGRVLCPTCKTQNPDNVDHTIHDACMWCTQLLPKGCQTTWGYPKDVEVCKFVQCHICANRLYISERVLTSDNVKKTCPACNTLIRVTRYTQKVAVRITFFDVPTQTNLYLTVAEDVFRCYTHVVQGIMTTKVIFLRMGHSRIFYDTDSMCILSWARRDVTP